MVDFFGVERRLGQDQAGVFKGGDEVLAPIVKRAVFVRLLNQIRQRFPQFGRGRDQLPVSVLLLIGRNAPFIISIAISAM